MLSYLREIVPYPSTLVGSSPPFLLSCSHYIQACLTLSAARAAPAVRAVTPLLNELRRRGQGSA